MHLFSKSCFLAWLRLSSVFFSRHIVNWALLGWPVKLSQLFWVGSLSHLLIIILPISVLLLILFFLEDLIQDLLIFCLLLSPNISFERLNHNIVVKNFKVAEKVLRRARLAIFVLVCSLLVRRRWSMRSLWGINIGRESALLYSRLLVVELLQAVQLVHELLLLSFTLVKRHAR